MTTYPVVSQTFGAEVGKSHRPAMTKSIRARPGRPPQFTHPLAEAVCRRAGPPANFPGSSSSTLGAVTFRGGGCRTEPPPLPPPSTAPLR
jgi:hypothetical protein